MSLTKLLKVLVDLVGIEPTTSSIAMQSERQPELCFQVVSNWYIGRKPVYWMIFPANFRPNFSVYNRRAAWAGVLAARFSSRIEFASRGFCKKTCRFCDLQRGRFDSLVPNVESQLTYWSGIA